MRLMRDDFDADCFIGNEYIKEKGTSWQGITEHISWLTERPFHIIISISFVRDTALWGVDPRI